MLQGLHCLSGVVRVREQEASKAFSATPSVIKNKNTKSST